MTISIQKLSNLSFFAQLGDEALLDILPHLHERLVAAGQVILIEGEPCQTVYFVARGLARTLRRSPDGHEQVLAYFGPGSVFDLVPLVDGGPHLNTVEAVIDTALYVMPCQVFHQIIADSPQVASTVTELLAVDVRRLSDMVEDLALHTVSTRLARFLLNQVENPPSTPRRWTQEEIAAHIGTAREMISRTLRAWTKGGLIRRERGRVVIVDRVGLEREAQG